MGRTSNADDRLMDAAEQLMWEESYGAITIDDICRRADVKKGSFYYFYKSKADLVVAALEKLWSKDWKAKLDNYFSPSADPLTRFNTYFNGLYGDMVELKRKHGKVLGCPVCTVGSEVSTQEPEVSAKIREILSHKRRYYESAIRDAVAQGLIEPCDPEQKALAVFGLLEGLVSQSRIMNDPEILKNLPEMALGVLRVKAASPVPASA
jgi:TetR/AcrR family transcriptional regulator, transcriptional repressor for nem operon